MGPSSRSKLKALVLKGLTLKALLVKALALEAPALKALVLKGLALKGQVYHELSLFPGESRPAAERASTDPETSEGQEDPISTKIREKKPGLVN